MKHRKHSLLSLWFTLVELIVVITILAILSTVAFVSLQWYGRSARDSARISDIRLIEKALILHRTEWNRYPSPENQVPFSYSGWIVWNQGTFGETARKATRTLSNLPIDPVTKNEYAYSVTTNQWEFQLAWMLEWELAYENTIIPQGYAAWNKVGRAFVVWDFNGRLVKTTDPTDVNISYILAVPTIISWDITLTDIETLLASQKLVYPNQSVTPASYVLNPESDFSDSETLDYAPVDILVFSGRVEGLQNEVEQLQLLQKLQQAYSWSIVAEVSSDIKNLVKHPVDTNNASNQSKNLIGGIINNGLKITVPSYWWTASTSSSVPTFGSCELTQAEIDWLNAFFALKPIYHEFAQGWCDRTVVSAFGQWLTWEIPSGLWKLTNLTQLKLNNNNLTGSIPIEIWNLTGLTYITIQETGLEGPIPESIGNLVSLENFYGQKNNFSGSIPSGFWNMPNLSLLELGHNNFTWAVPESFWNLDNLPVLILDDNNLSSLHSSIDQMDALHTIQIYDNPNLSVLPDSLVNMTELTGVLLNNTNLWSLATNFESYSSAETQTGVTNTWKSMTIEWDGTYVDITVTDAGWWAPVTLGTCWLTQTEIDDMNTFFNWVSGFPIADAQTWCNLTYLTAYNQWLTWSIPDWVWKLTSLTNLLLNDNNLTWTIPEELWNLVNLWNLNLHTNNFSGPLPDGIGNLTALGELHLHTNNFSGPLPSSMWNLTNVYFFFLQNNSFSGALPESLWNLNTLTEMVLNHNNFSSLNTSIDQMTALTSIDIWNNPLLDELPDTLANKTNLTSVLFYLTDLWWLATSINKWASTSGTQGNITNSWKTMTITVLWDDTLDITVTP